MAEIPQSVRFQEAMEMYRSGRDPRKEDAAVVAEMRVSTFVHCSLGRRSAEDYSKSRRLLTAEEEEVIIWRCEILQRTGFPQTTQDVRRIAESVLQKRDPDGRVGPRWVDQSFYTHHPEIKARWSQQLDNIRARKGNNHKSLEMFYISVKPATSSSHELGFELIQEDIIVQVANIGIYFS